MYPETKFKPDRRITSNYQNPNNIYNNIDLYLSSRTGGTTAHDNSHSSSSQERDYRNKSFEYHEKYGGNLPAVDPTILLNKSSIPTKKNYPSRKPLHTNTGIPKQVYTSQIVSPKNYSSNMMSAGETQKSKASLSAYNLIPKSLLNDENKKPNQQIKETKSTNAQNTTTNNKRNSLGQYPTTSNKRNSLGQYPVTKAGHNKRNSGNYESKRRSQGHPVKSKSDNILQKPKLGVIGVLSAKKSLNEFSKRSSRVLNQQTEEINNLKARIQELTSDQEILRKLNEVSTEDTLLEFNDKYLTPLLNKMSTYLMKFSSEYNEMIKSNSDFIDSQHDRTECLVELAANLNSQLNNFIEDFECEKFDERTYNEKRSQIDVIADTTSRLNSQIARVVLQLDDFRDSPDFQKDNMTNSIQSLGVILQQLNKAAITVNQRINEYENTIQQKDEIFIRDQNSKDIEIDALKHKIRDLNLALKEKPVVKELEAQNRKLMETVNESYQQKVSDVPSDVIEKYKNDLVTLNHNLANVTLLFDSEIKQKNDLMKKQEQKINDFTQRAAKLNSQLANLTLIFDSEINLKNRIIKDKEAQIEKLRKTAAELNHNLSVISLLSNEKDISNKRNINDLMNTISNLQTKWADINRNLLNLTSTVNDQLRSKNEEIRLNRQDAVYFRDFTFKLHKQMMDYVGDFLQRIWDKNHENEILIAKNKDLLNHCSDLNGRVARFTLEINDLQKENNMLINKLTNGEPMATREVVREVVREVPVVHEVVREVPVVHEVVREVPVSLENNDKVDYYKNMAVDLNNRVAILSLDIDALKLNKYNNDNIEVIYTDVYEDESKIDFYRNQAVALNTNLAKLTLEHNDFKNKELLKKEYLIKNSEEKIEYYQQLAANLNTKLAILSLEMNDIKKDISKPNDNNDEKFVYYQNLVFNLNSRINDLIIENEELKAKQNEIQQQERSITQEIIPISYIPDNQNEINHFRDLAVDLNTRLAKLTLEFNKKPKNIESKYDEEYIKKIQNQVVDLNQRLSVLTLDSNDEINHLKKLIAEKDQNNYRNKVVELNQRLATVTLNDNDEIKNLKKQIAYLQNQPIIKEKTVSDDYEEILYTEIYEDESTIDFYRNQAVSLNSNLAKLTLNSNDEINFLKRQLAQKELDIDQLRYRLAIMNRQIIDLTFNSNQQNAIPIDVQSRNVDVNENRHYEAIINEKDLIIRQLQAQLNQINIQTTNNDAALQVELENEKRKNQELNQTLNAMRSEMQSITDYLKETASCAASMQNLNNENEIVANPAIYQEINSLAEYLKETKHSLEEYKNNHDQELKSLSEYLKDTINMAEEYKNNNAQELNSLSEYLKDTIHMAEEYKNNNAQELNSLSEYLKDTIQMAEEYKSNNINNDTYDSEETVDNQI